MKKMLILFLVVFTSTAMFAATLRERVGDLEKRVAALELYLKPQLEAAKRVQNVEPQRAKAKLRGAEDKKIYSVEELEKIEQIYQTWQSKETKLEDVATELLKKYPKSNRTGCALLYLARFGEKDKQIERLQLVIKDHGDCFYYDGTQVGPYALFCLGEALEDAGKTAEAKKCFAELKTSYPGAIRHNGELLVDAIE